MTEQSPDIGRPNIDVSAAPDVPLLRIEGVSKKFGTFRAVDRLSLDIGAGEFFALLGPSGCGKTTLLRMLAGFETPDEGRILLDGRNIAQVPPHLRPVNMMFQNYALFPHLTVQDNIAFGVMDAGRLEQVASPRELYEAPRSRWVAEFVGDVNLFDGEVTSREHNRLMIATKDAGMLSVAEPREPVTKPVVSVAIRPEKVKLS